MFKDNKFLKIYMLLALVYFGQGIFGLPSQSIFYLMKETWGLTVDKIAYIGALATIPWTIKPIYGIISDAFPLFGYRRKSYLIINYILIILLGLYVFFFGLTIPSLIAINILCAICFAMNDVACDGIMVAKGQKYNLTGKFQSVQWSAISIASLITGLVGGLIAEYLNYRIAYLFVVIFILGILIYMIKFYTEKKVKYTYKYDKEWEEHIAGLWGQEGSFGIQLIALIKGYFQGLLWMAFGWLPKSILKAFKEGISNKQLWLALAFLFCLWFSPSFGLALMFKMRDTLNFNKIFIGLLSTTGSAFGILGAIVYWKICKKINLKKLLYITTFLAGVTTFCYLYYPNWQVALFYAVIFGVFGMISHLVILDYAARITPKEAEAFTFAGICSVLNLGAMGSRVLGGWLYPKIGLDWLIIISGVFTLICLAFIPFLKIGETK